jgi:hypothetical protein
MEARDSVTGVEDIGWSGNYADDDDKNDSDDSDTGHTFDDDDITGDFPAVNEGACDAMTH